MTRMARFRPLARLFAWVACLSLASAAEPAGPDAPPRIRRIYVPADVPVDQWPIGGRQCRPVAPEVFEEHLRLLNAARSGSPGTKAGRLGRGVLKARLAGDELVDGTAEFEVVRLQETPGLLPWPDLKLPISAPEWVGTPPEKAFLGLHSDGRTALLADRSGTVRFGWGLRGRRISGEQLQFLPSWGRATGLRLELDVPAELQPLCTPGVAEEPQPSATAGHRRWAIELGGAAHCDLRFVPTDWGKSAAASTLIRESSTYEISPSGLDLAVRLDLETLQGVLSEIRIRVDDDLRLVSLREGDTALRWTEPKPAAPSKGGGNDGAKGNGGPREFVVDLSGRPGRKRTLSLRGYAPPAIDRDWRLPTIRAIGGVWQEGRATLRVPPPWILQQLRLPEIDGRPTGRQTSVGSLPGTDGGVAIGIEFFSQEAAVSVRLGSRERLPRARSTTLLNWQPDRIVAETIADFSASESRAFLIEADLGPRWLVESVTARPAEMASNWRIVPGAGNNSRLEVQLSRPLAEGVPLRLTVLSRYPKPPLDEPLGWSQLLPLRWNGSEDSEVRLGAAAAPPLRLEWFSAEAGVLRRPEDLGETALVPEGDVPPEWIVALNRAAGDGSIAAKRPVPRVRSAWRSSVLLTPDAVWEEGELRIEPLDDVPLEELLIQLPAGGAGEVDWRPADDLGTNLVTEIVRQESAEIEVRRLRFRPAAEGPLRLRFERNRPATAGVHRLSLPTLQARGRHTGAIEIRQWKLEGVGYETQGITPFPPRGHDAESPWTRRAFAYETEDQGSPGSIEVALPRDGNPPAAYALRGLLETVRLPDGSTVRQYSAWIRNHGRDRVRCNWPAGAEVQQAWLGNRPSTANGPVCEFVWPKQAAACCLRLLFRLPPPAPNAPSASPWPELDLPVLERTEWETAAESVGRISDGGGVPLAGFEGSPLERLFGTERVGATSGPPGPADPTPDEATAAARRMERFLAALNAAHPDETVADCWEATHDPRIDDEPLVLSVPLEAAGFDPAGPAREAVRAAAGLILVRSKGQWFLTTAAWVRSRHGTAVPAGRPRIFTTRDDLAGPHVVDPPQRFGAWVETCPPVAAVPPDFLGTLRPPAAVGSGERRGRDAAFFGRPAGAGTSVLSFGWWTVGAAALACGLRGGWAHVLPWTTAGGAALLLLLLPWDWLPPVRAIFWGSCLGWTLRECGERFPLLLRRWLPGRRSALATAGAAALLVLPTFSEPERAGGAEAAAATDEYVVFIPVREDRTPVVGMEGGMYMVPLDLDRELRRRTERAKAVPTGWILRSVRHILHPVWNPDRREFDLRQATSRFEGKAFTAEPLRIPLGAAAASSVPAWGRLDGRSVPTSLGPGGELTVPLESPGDFVLDLTWQPRLKSADDLAWWDFPVLPVPDQRCAAVGPEPLPAIEFPLAQGIAETIDGSPSVALGPQTSLFCQWRNQLPQPRRMSRPQGELLGLIKVLPGHVILDVKLRLNVAEGSLRRLEVEADPRLEPLRPWSGPGLLRVVPAGLAESSGSAVLEWSRPMSGVFLLETSYLLKDASGIGRFRLPELRFPELDLQRAWLGIHVDPSLEYAAELPKELPPDAFRTAWNAADSFAATKACEWPAEEAPAVEWSTRPRAPRILGREELRLFVQPERIGFELKANVMVTDSPCFRHRFRIPEDCHIEGATVTEFAAQRSLTWFREESRSVTVFLNASGIGLQQLQLKGYLPSRPAGTVPLPDIGLEDCVRESRRILVYRRPSLRIAVEPPPTLSPVPDRDLWLDDYRLTADFADEAPRPPHAPARRLKIEPNRPRVQGRGDMTAVKTADGWNLELRWTIDKITQGTLDQLVFETDDAHLPPTLDVPWIVRQKRLAGRRTRWTLLPTVPAGPFRATALLRFPFKSGETPILPIPRPEPLSQLNWTVWLPDDFDGRRLSWSTTRLVPLAPQTGLVSEPQPANRQAFPIPPEQAGRRPYRIAGEPAAARLRASSSAAGEGSLPLQRLRLRGIEGSRLLVEIDALLVPGDRRVALLRLPPGGAMTAVEGDGGPLAWEALPGRLVRIPLPHSGPQWLRAILTQPDDFALDGTARTPLPYWEDRPARRTLLATDDRLEPSVAGGVPEAGADGAVDGDYPREAAAAFVALYEGWFERYAPGPAPAARREIDTAIVRLTRLRSWTEAVAVPRSTAFETIGQDPLEAADEALRGRLDRLLVRLAELRAEVAGDALSAGVSAQVAAEEGAALLPPPRLDGERRILPSFAAPPKEIVRRRTHPELLARLHAAGLNLLVALLLVPLIPWLPRLCEGSGTAAALIAVAVGLHFDALGFSGATWLGGAAAIVLFWGRIPERPAAVRETKPASSMKTRLGPSILTG